MGLSASYNKVLDRLKSRKADAEIDWGDQFESLPVELKLKIWKFTIEGRIFTLSSKEFKAASTVYHHLGREYSLLQLTLRPLHDREVPALLHINRLSRQVGLGEYALQPSKSVAVVSRRHPSDAGAFRSIPPYQHKIYIHPDYDSLYMRTRPVYNFRSLFSYSRALSTKIMIGNLAIDAEVEPADNELFQGAPTEWFSHWVVPVEDILLEILSVNVSRERAFVRQLHRSKNLKTISLTFTRMGESLEYGMTRSHWKNLKKRGRLVLRVEDSEAPGFDEDDDTILNSLQETLDDKRRTHIWPEEDKDHPIKLQTGRFVSE